MSTAKFRFDEASLSHPGKVRKVNEDSMLARGAEGLWAVADGMGGHANGQRASQTIVAALSEAALRDDFDADVAAVSGALHAANAAICGEAASLGASMGSTAVALLVRGGRFAVFWAGDSRVYLRREGVLHQLTRDHSQVQEMVDAGYLSPQDAEKHPMAHVLSRAIGVQGAVELEAVSDEVQVGDTFLLCSDGLTRTVSDAEIAEELGARTPRAAAERLVATSLERGAPDNVTVVIVACNEATLLAFA